MYKKYSMDIIDFDKNDVFAEGLDQGAVSGGEIPVLPDDEDD